MKQNKTLLTALVLLIATGAMYRLIPGRPLGFAPQIAMAVFAGAALRDKKWAFALPLFSMLLSDALYELLFRAGIVNMPGFYQWQWINYILIAGITFIGMAVKRISLLSVALAALAAPLVYFLLSNGYVWLTNGGYVRPKTFAGLIQCYADGHPFLKGSIE